MLRVGLTERHGMLVEQTQNPPEGVIYSFPEAKRYGSKLFKSSIKGFMSDFDLTDIDIVEAVLSPIWTKKPWIQSLARFQEPLAYSLGGLPTPRSLRIALARIWYAQKNCLALTFWSRAGYNTLKTYGKVTSGALLDKSKVVYPAIRFVDTPLKTSTNTDVNILFSGDFFRKGGANVVEAFEKLQITYPEISLTICSDEKIDFITQDVEMRHHYLKRIESNPRIRFGRISRKEMLESVLPETDIFLIPTYNEAFGYAILEAMAYGIPVVATNIFAIPEMIENNETGFTIDVDEYDMEKLFAGYIVNHIPEDLVSYITNQLTDYLQILIEDASLRTKFGAAGREVARTKFSVEKRNYDMLEIYQDAVRRKL